MTGAYVEPHAGEWPAQPWACPDGKAVTRASTGEAEWLRARDGLVGASEVGKLFGLTPQHGNAFTLWAAKTGRTPHEPTTDAQARGHALEAAVIDLWVERFAPFPIRTRRQGLMRSRRWPHLGATVDRLSVCRMGDVPHRCLVEIKTSANMAEWDGDEVPTSIQVQGQVQLAVTGREHVHYVVLGPRLVPEHRVIPRDEPLIYTLGERVETWWQRHIVEDEAPAPTGVDRAALSRVYRLGQPGKGEAHTITDDEAPHVHALLDAAADRKDADERYDTAAAILQAVMGTATELLWPDGTAAATWRAERTVDGVNAAFRKAHPDLVERYSTPVDKVDAAKLAENEPQLVEAGLLRYRRSFKIAGAGR